MKNRTIFTRVSMLLLLLICSPLLIAQSGHPGRVDFNSLAGFEETNVTVDVQLGGWLLSWARAAAEDDEDMRFLSQIESVRVKVFEVSARKNYQQQANQVVDSLMDDGWERFARVTEKDNWVHILVKGDADRLQGITVIAMDEDSEAVLVNISGQLNPDDVASILNDEDLIHMDLDWDV
ncbi:MAG: DUF4252 domain-containing protein [Lysobacterales bacterium]